MLRKDRRRRGVRRVVRRRPTLLCRLARNLLTALGGYASGSGLSALALFALRRMFLGRSWGAILISIGRRDQLLARENVDHSAE